MCLQVVVVVVVVVVLLMMFGGGGLDQTTNVFCGPPTNTKPDQPQISLKTAAVIHCAPWMLQALPLLRHVTTTGGGGTSPLVVLQGDGKLGPIWDAASNGCVRYADAATKSSLCQKSVYYA